MPQQTLLLFDESLARAGQRLDAIVIGGSALALLGVTDRQTRDVDILAPELSAEVRAVAREFAAEQRRSGNALDDEWLNNGPQQLTAVLPDGWRERLQPLFRGSALELTTLGRPDLLKTKLFALCDRGTDLPDCIALRPTQEELEEAVPWLEQQDANDAWPAHVRETLRDLSRRLGHGI